MTLLFVHFECSDCKNTGFRAGWVTDRHPAGEVTYLYQQLICLGCGAVSVPAQPPASLIRWDAK